MKSPEEIRRLLDDAAGIDGELKLGLERMSTNVPSSIELASLAARLGVKPAPANGGAPASKTLLKAAAAAGVSGAVLWALLHGSASVNSFGEAPVRPKRDDVPVVSHPASPAASHGGRSAPAEPVANERAPAAQGALAAPTPSAGADETAALAVPPAETPEGSKPSDRAANPRPASPTPPSERAAAKAPSRAPTPIDGSPAPARPPAASPPSETALLRDARLALNGDPAQALALTEQHRREYPNGGFAQEREVIAITALARLGRTSEARSRAERFRSAYRTSPYTERVNRAVPP